MDESRGPVVFVSGATATVTQTAGVLVVALAGEVDECFSRTGASLTRTVAAAGKPVHVDLSEVTFFTAAGVAWLVSLYAAADNEVRVVAMSPVVREVLGLCDVPTTSLSLGAQRQAGRYADAL